ncbi:hypothetical protein SKA08_15580, partial [Enterococcus faecium]
FRGNVVFLPSGPHEPILVFLKVIFDFMTFCVVSGMLRTHIALLEIVYFDAHAAFLQICTIIFIFVFPAVYKNWCISKIKL